MRNKIFWTVVVCIIFFLTLLAAGAAMAGAKDTVRVGMYSDPTTVNPFRYKTGNDEVAFGSMFQGMLKVDDKTGDLVLGLAESLKIMENGKDIRIKLRKGPKFPAGDPVTAHDVRFSWRQHLNKKNKSLLRSVYKKILDVEIIDDYNFIYRFKEPYAPWESLMSMSIGSKNYYDKVGMDGFNKKPVGSGPFNLIERKISERITMEAVKNHHDHKVDFKTLQLVTVPDDMTRLAMLETGELDLVYYILPHLVKRIERRKEIKVKRSGMAPSYFALSLRANPKDRIIRDRNLSRALNYAINRQELIDKIFLGEGYPHYMGADRNEYGYDPDFKYEFDPEKARKMIKASSYKPGTPLMLTYVAEMPHAAHVAAAVQKYMKDVGVTIKLQLMDEGVFLTYSRTNDPRLGHIITYSWAGDRDPIWRMMLGVKSDGFYTNYKNRPNKDVIDRLCDAQAIEMNKEKRLAILREIHKLLQEDPSVIPLFGLNMIYAMRDWIDYNWLPKSADIAHLWNIKVVK
ncbi:MAG: ABC transporter substrate-binding protein [Deltaproteobacteria bacterium]|nr:ABC transporter substrate-binding protein [Deltaproteobacteria bacterium]